MFVTHIKTAFKNLFRSNNYGYLNISILTVGLTAFILIMIYVVDEFSYDKHLVNSDTIYRIVNNSKNEQGIGENSSGSPFPLGPSLKQEYPEYISQSVRVFNFWQNVHLIKVYDQTFEINDFFYVDKEFFEVFKTKNTPGFKENPLEKPYSVVITKARAKQFFGDVDPVGKQIKYLGKIDFTVTAVIDDPPTQTHFKYGVLASFSTLDSLFEKSNFQLHKGWIWNPCWTYIVLKDGQQKTGLLNHLQEFVKRHFPSNESLKVKLDLQPVKDIHLKSDLDYEIEPNSEYTNAVILLTLGFLILVIAIVNYINITTASGIRRMDEIAIKMVNGAKKKDVFTQVLIESILASMISFVLAITITELLLPYYAHLTHKNFLYGIASHGYILLLLLSSGFLTGLIAGIYPALYLSNFNPLRVLQNKRSGVRKSSVIIRKALVVTQFTISIVMIILSLGIHQQYNFLKHKNLGFNYENIVVINTENFDFASKYLSFKNQLKTKIPAVRFIAGSHYVLGVDHNLYAFVIHGTDTTAPYFCPGILATEDFVDVYDLKLNSQWNEKDTENVILKIYPNEAYMNYSGSKPGPIKLGSSLSMPSIEGRVFGITPNYHVSSLRDSLVPFLLAVVAKPELEGKAIKYLLIKTDGKNNAKTINDLQLLWKDYFPEIPFKYQWQKDMIFGLYKNERTLYLLALMFTIISVFMAGMGILGLTSYLTFQRTREVGIRKALGAKSMEILYLYLKEFSILFFISVLIACPVSWLMLEAFNRNFAYTTEAGIIVYFIAMLLSLVIAVIIISYHTCKAANSTPTDALRHE
jgi:putative ABC transport system permease protein